MRDIQSWLDEYSMSHRNPKNKLIHWICVPIILWTVIALLWSIPFPAFAGPWINVATIVAFLSILYYAMLSLSLALGMTVISGFFLYSCHLLSAHVAMPLWLIAIVAFVLAWIGQFIGHEIEGKKPSFFRDVQFLMIGPAWLLHFIYRKAGIPYQWGLLHSGSGK